MAQQIINIGTAANDGTGTNWRDAWDYTNDNFTELYNSQLSTRVVVKSASDLSGTLSSSVEYFIDGVIDMGSQSIEVPAGGLYLAGYNFDVSKLTSTAANYTMFTSGGSGSGNVLGKDYAIEVTGSGSKVYDLSSATGFEAFEFTRINYNNCTSLGTINNYRQGLETGTGRFGGAPTLELSGAWVGGFLIDTSIVRNLSSGMTEGLFKAGAGFVMASRFRMNMNVDLPTSAPLFDFAPANFTNPSTVQLNGCIITRNGVFDASDTNVTPNISGSDLEAQFRDNIGLNNTFEGGNATITAETATTISASSTYYDLNGTWTSGDLDHFDSPSNGQLRHLGDNPREYKAVGDLVLDSTSGDELKVKILKYDSSAASFVDVFIQTRQVNAFVGGRDVAFFNFSTNLTLDQNDYVKLQVSNESSTSNVTAELDSFFSIEKR